MTMFPFVTQPPLPSEPAFIDFLHLRAYRYTHFVCVGCGVGNQTECGNPSMPGVKCVCAECLNPNKKASNSATTLRLEVC